MSTSLLELCLIQLGVVLVGAMSVSAGALVYFRRVRLDRPPVGTFNLRDIAILLGFVTALPFLYATLPRWALTCFLGMTFASALSIGYRPLLGAGRVWLGVGLLVGANLWTSRTMLGTVFGWQLWWAELSILVVLSAIAVANLYVQGGMKLRYVAWFALALAVYDLTFVRVVPLTNQLVQDFLGKPLDPSLGMRFGINNYSMGIGDLLVYGLFTVAAYKAYGRSAARLAIGLIVVFGVCAPTLVPLLIDFLDARSDVIVPAQAFFGPAAFVGYLRLKSRYGPERTMAEYRARGGVARRTPTVTHEAPTSTPVGATA